MSFSLCFVRMYYSESWLWSHFNNIIECLFSRKLRKWLSCFKITSACLITAAKYWVLFYECTFNITSLRFFTPTQSAVLRRRLCFCTATLRRCANCHVHVLFVPGIVASTLKIPVALGKCGKIMCRLFCHILHRFAVRLIKTCYLK